MEAIKIESIADSVKRYLETCIFTGKFKPGQQIKEQEVAESLGISRPPIREALKSLEAEGLITRKPNRGAFVTEIEEKDIWEIYTLKMALYGLATQLAFDMITEELVQKWEILIKDMEEAISSSPPDIARYQELHEEFHDIMFDTAGHERLKKIVLNLHKQVKRYSYQSLGDQVHLEKSFNYHKAILEAIKERDMEKTIVLTKEHVIEGLKVLQDMMRKRKGISRKQLNQGEEDDEV